MTARLANEVWNDRLEQLAADIMDPHLEPGPLDREDIRDALGELLDLRKGTANLPQLAEAVA